MERERREQEQWELERLLRDATDVVMAERQSLPLGQTVGTETVSTTLLFLLTLCIRLSRLLRVLVGR